MVGVYQVADKQLYRLHREYHIAVNHKCADGTLQFLGFYHLGCQPKWLKVSIDDMTQVIRSDEKIQRICTELNISSSKLYAFGKLFWIGSNVNFRREKKVKR